MVRAHFRLSKKLVLTVELRRDVWARSKYSASVGTIWNTDDRAAIVLSEIPLDVAGTPFLRCNRL